MSGGWSLGDSLNHWRKHADLPPVIFPDLPDAELIRLVGTLRTEVTKHVGASATVLADFNDSAAWALASRPEYRASRVAFVCLTAARLLGSRFKPNWAAVEDYVKGVTV